MNRPPAIQTDPRGWIALIAGLFFLLVMIRLGTPTRIYFDEVHYVKASRVLMQFNHITNREHPLVGKQLIAAGIALFGDRAWSWRIFPALAGVLTMFAFMRALWLATYSRFAPLAGGVLLATGFLVYMQSRIAMLDIFMICFATVAMWMLAGAIRFPEKARGRLILAGISLGLALGSKWTAAPIVALPGIVFLVMRVWGARWKFLTRKDCGPIPGISLIEAGIWLGVLPFVTYLATFWPVFFYYSDPLTIGGYVEYHQKMWELQQQTVKPHPYMSRWWQWVLDLRPVWYLYENIDGAQRGVLFIGNPFTMIFGIYAVLWCAFQGVMRRNRAALAASLGYFVTLGMWIVAPKPIQFYYHYLLPSCFLLAAVALLLDHWWNAGRRQLALGILAGSLVVFSLFFPIISGAELGGPYAFEHWMWLKSWR